MANIKTIKFVIESSLELTPLVGRAVKGLCSSIPINDQEIYQLELCIVEAVNNIILHAYGNEDGHEIEVHFILSPDNIIVKIYDTGKCGNPLVIEDEFTYFDPDHYEKIPESGMGVFIMKSFMDEIHYEIKEGKNIVTLRKNFKVKLTNGNSK